MAQQQPKVFISAVSSEFGGARDKIRSDLSARDRTVRVQSDFRQDPESDTLLGMLARYIHDCHRVICVVGKRSGASPQGRETEGFPAVLPARIKEASYTQWEYFLARYYRRRTYVYIARDDYEPDKDAVTGDRSDLQSAFVEFLQAEGVQYTPFSTAEELRIAVMRDEPESAADEDTSRAKSKPIVLPYPSIGHLFKGRDRFMARLRESLNGTHGGRTAIFSSQALYGLGGIGKTRAAVEYAWANADKYNALLFVVAETPETLRRNLAALSETLAPQPDTAEDAAKVAAALDWLRTNPGWFLIIDNVDDKEALAEVKRLLAGLSGGHVIMTSRLADFPPEIQPLELDVLEIGDAAAFLLERTEGRRRVAADDEAQARVIAQEVGRLALALEQAAAFVGKKRLTFGQYLEQWRSKRDDVLAWFDPALMHYPRAVAVTWQTSVDQLTEGGRRLLERLAWIEPEKVPESLLDVPVPGAEGENLREAYDDLAAYSLITRDAEGPFFLVHRLVQDVTRRSLAAGPRQPSVVEAAERLYRHALAIDERRFGPDDPNVAADLNNLAQLLRTTDRDAAAEPLVRRALAIAEKSFGPDHPMVAICLNNLAELLRATDRTAEAEPLYRRALVAAEKGYGIDQPQVATCLNNFALLLQATGRLAEAEPLYGRALAIAERNFGPDHPMVATCLNNLAGLLQTTDRLTEAEPMMRRALAIFIELTRRTGYRHPHVETTLRNYRELLRAAGKSKAQIKAACAELVRPLQQASSVAARNVGERNHRA